MSIFDRIRRIAMANIDWLLDKAEPAEQELEAKIKELAAVILEGRESAATYGATFKRMERELAQLQQQQETLQSQAQTALQAGDENTARQALTEKVKLGERITQLKPGVQRGRQTFEQLRQNLIKLQEQLKAARLKLDGLKARRATAQAQQAFEKHLDAADYVTGDAVAFERLEDEVLQTEAEVEIRQEMRGDTLTDLDLAQRARDLQVEAEIQSLKEELQSD